MQDTATCPKNFPIVPFFAESSIFIEIQRKWKGFELVQPETVIKERSRVTRSNLSATAAPLPWRPLPCRSLFHPQIIFKIVEDPRCAHLELITSLMKVIDQKIRLTVIND